MGDETRRTPWGLKRGVTLSNVLNRNGLGHNKVEMIISQVLAPILIGDFPSKETDPIVEEGHEGNPMGDPMGFPMGIPLASHGISHGNPHGK